MFGSIVSSIISSIRATKSIKIPGGRVSLGFSATSRVTSKSPPARRPVNIRR